MTPPGHWNLFAQAVSRRDGHSLDHDVRLFFALGNALLDASVAVWDCKRRHDFARPITATRSCMPASRSARGQVRASAPDSIDGARFRSYIPTPPFAEYVSGHSTFSAASAEILALFTGSDRFGFSVAFPPGSSFVEPGVTPAATVVLSWPTFSEAADEAGLSRRFGGIHFESGDLQARALGRRIGRQVWRRAMQFVDESAKKD